MTPRVFLLAAIALVLLPAVSQAYSVVWMDPELHYDYNPVIATFDTNYGDPIAHASFGAWQGYAAPGYNVDPGLCGAYMADFYCVDVLTGMWGDGHDWEVYATDAVPSSALAAHISEFGLGWAANLYNNLAAGLQNDYGEQAQLQRAALQIAIYEAVYDGVTGYTWDLHGGNFQVVTLENIDYFQYAPGQYFANTDDFLTRYVAPMLTGYQNQAVGGYWNDGQDLLGPNPVPEPATILLVGLGLMGSGLALRLRKR